MNIWKGSAEITLFPKNFCTLLSHIKAVFDHNKVILLLMILNVVLINKGVGGQRQFMLLKNENSGRLPF